LFDMFREHVLSIDVCHIYLQRIVLSLLHTLYEMNSSMKQVFGEMDDPMMMVKRIAALDEIEAWLKELCGKAVLAIYDLREDHNSRQIDKAMDYVKHHYMDSELSLKTVCKHVSISSSYFSSLFKQHTGRTFIEYVTFERMEKAKELLKMTSLKSYEIAYAVGFSDPHYFSVAFKKHTGDTPTDYRNKTMEWKV